MQNTSDVYKQTLASAIQAALRSLFSGDEPSTIRFYKANGDVREMTVTTNPEIIGDAGNYEEPSAQQLLESLSRPSMSVYDVNDGWRSFKLDKLFEVNGEHPSWIVHRYMRTELLKASVPESELTGEQDSGK
jgi:hypothetical protein